MHLEDALKFIRESDEQTWRVMTREMILTRKRRNERAAQALQVGELVRFEPPDAIDRLEGRIEKITRGRVTVELTAQYRGMSKVSVPAGMVKKVA